MSFNDFKNVLVSKYDEFRHDGENDVFANDTDRIVRKNVRSVLIKVYANTADKSEDYAQKFLEQEITWAVEDRDDARGKENPVKIAVTESNLALLLDFYDELKK